jgi:hypothetical protein
MPPSTASHALLQALGYDVDALPPDVPPEPRSFATGCAPETTPREPTAAEAADGVVAAYDVAHDGGAWTLLLKVALAAADVAALAVIAARFAPRGTTVSMQPDAHGAGNVYVGLIMTYEAERLPINFVSGDIGCGLSVVPVVRPPPPQPPAPPARPPHAATAARAYARYEARIASGADGDAVGDWLAAEDELTGRVPPEAPRHVHVHEGDGAAEFHAYVLAKARGALKRGAAAENGSYLSSLVQEAAAFYGYDELPRWLDEMRAVLDAVGIRFTDYARSERDKARADASAALKARHAAQTAACTNGDGHVVMGAALCQEQRYEIDAAAAAALPTYDGLTPEQSVVLRYVGRYAQSLGSSGNHFLELATDADGAYWLVVHSGSRGLGAKVYDVIAGACRLLNAFTPPPDDAAERDRGSLAPSRPPPPLRGFEVATGALARFYTRAYDALNKFAKLNRMLCALAVLDALGMETRAAALRAAMCAAPLFAPAIGRCGGDASAVLALLSGLTHNGIKAYAHHAARAVLFVMSKGAVSMTRRAAAAIVALRAGEGCYVWTMADAGCPWVEVDVAAAAALVAERGYAPVPEARGDVVYSGHGAGRARATGQTARMSSFDDVVAFYEAHDVAGNVAPQLLGDNPAKAYNDVATIKAKLPLGRACTHGWLRTRVSYKEGIVQPFQKREIAACGEFIHKHWDGADDVRRAWFDYGVSRAGLGAGRIAQMDAQRAAWLEAMDAKYGGRPPAHMRGHA